MARKTHIDLTDLTLFGVTGDYLGLFKSANFDWEAATQPGRAVSQRYQLAIPVKKKLVFTIDELITNSIRQSNLNVTVFTVGGTSYLGTLRSGTLKIDTDAKEASGVADLWEFPYACGTDYSIDGELQIASTAVFAALLAASGTSGLLVTVSVALGGMTFTAPMTLTKSGHKITEGDLQSESISLKCRGTVSVATGNPVLASIALGTAVIAYNATTGAGQVSGNALITGTQIQWADSQLISASHTFANQGTPTWA